MSRSQPLLTAHVHLAVRPERDARKLRKRFGQGTVLSAWLIEQAAIIERVRRRAKRRRNLGARLIEADGRSSVIRRWLLCRARGDGGHRAHQDHSSHAGNLGLVVSHFKRRPPLDEQPDTVRES